MVYDLLHLSHHARQCRHRRKLILHKRSLEANASDRSPIGPPFSTSLMRRILHLSMLFKQPLRHSLPHLHLHNLPTRPSTQAHLGLKETRLLRLALQLILLAHRRCLGLSHRIAKHQSKLSNRLRKDRHSALLQQVVNRRRHHLRYHQAPSPTSCEKTDPQFLREPRPPSMDRPLPIWMITAEKR